MHYDIADVTSIEFDRTFVFEPKIKLFIGSSVAEVINCSKIKNPYGVFIDLNAAWLKARTQKYGTSVLSE